MTISPPLSFVVTDYGDCSERLLRLIRALEPHPVVIRFDGSDGQLSREVRDAAQVLPDQSHMGWGSWEFVQGVQDALAAGPATEWTAVISGDSFPARPVDEFVRWLGGAEEDAVIKFMPEGSPADRDLRFVVHDEGSARYTFHTRELPPRTLRAWRLLRRVNRAQPWVRVQPRYRGLSPLLFFRVPMRGITPVAGANWFVLRRTAVDALLSADARLERHFARTYIPSEGFVPTVLASNRDLAIKDDYFMYEKWEPDAASPKTLSLADFDDVVGSGKFFARKVGGGDLAVALQRHISGRVTCR